MIRKITTISVEKVIIPNKFDVHFNYDAETEKAEIYYYEYVEDREILKNTKREMKKMFENSKWNYPDVEFSVWVRKNKIGVHIKGPRRYVIQGLLQEILVQAKCVMSDDDIYYLVDMTRFVEEK